tara:strand:+ start:418 stop:894 length:477 start_codon:yes stop_codon:yes gene_type:complete
MKNIIIILTLGLIFSCNNPNGEQTQTKTKESFYGDLINTSEIINISEVKNSISQNGKIETKIQGEILSTCAKKGCWMKLKTEEDTLMVRFKDYSFFVPKEGVEGRNAIIQGEAYYDTLTVELLQHYAQDAGKSEDEILAITDPEYNFLFEASGVIIQE